MSEYRKLHKINGSLSLIISLLTIDSIQQSKRKTGPKGQKPITTLTSDSSFNIVMTYIVGIASLWILYMGWKAALKTYMATFKTPLYSAVLYVNTKLLYSRSVGLQFQYILS